MKRSTIINLMAAGLGCGIVLLQLAFWAAGIAATVWIAKWVWTAI